MVELDKRKASNLKVNKQSVGSCKYRQARAHLCIARVGIEHIGEEFTSTSHARDDQPVNVETINDKQMGKVIVFSLRVQARRNG